jgi:hypothetical protein
MPSRRGPRHCGQPASGEAINPPAGASAAPQGNHATASQASRKAFTAKDAKNAKACGWDVFRVTSLTTVCHV